MLEFRIGDLKATTKGLLVRLLKRHTGPFRYRRRWLDRTQWYGSNELRKLQLELLKKMIRHAYDTVPYYTRLMQELKFKPTDIKCLDDIQKFPVMTKSDLKVADNDVVSRKFSRFFLRTAYTGGTTGERFKLKRDLGSIANEHAFVRRQFDWAGIKLLDRCAYMMARVISATNQKLDKPYVYDAATKELTLSVFHLSDEVIPTYAKAIVDYKIKALIGHPSAISILAKGCLDKRIYVPLRSVLTTAEILDSAKREIISKVFKCKIYDFYGSAERVCYIHTCEHGNYHIIPEYGLTELVSAEPPNDDFYRVIATGFWNMAMPLIRYDTGDLVQPGDRTCQCGRVFPVIKKIVGRESNVLATPSGRILGASALEALMENVLFDMQNMPILQGQMVQESFDVMILEYVPLKAFSNEDADKLRTLMAKHLPSDFKTNIRPVEKISRTVSGKALSLSLS